MSNCPEELRYTASHEWIRVEEDNVATIGISDYAQSQLGELVFIELPEVSQALEPGDEVVVVESVKTAADVYSPVSGEITAVNESLNESPQNVNQDPYGDGWLFQIKMSDPAQVESLMSAENYRLRITEE